MRRWFRRLLLLGYLGTAWITFDYWRWHHTGRSPFNPTR
jgi:hypothetical protein